MGCGITIQDGVALKRLFVHTRLRVQRGQAFVGMLFSTLAVVGIWRDSLPLMPWWVLLAAGGAVYLGLAWVLGYFDDTCQLAKIEQEWYGDRNPLLTETLRLVRQLHQDRTALDSSIPRQEPRQH